MTIIRVSKFYFFPKKKKGGGGVACNLPKKLLDCMNPNLNMMNELNIPTRFFIPFCFLFGFALTFSQTTTTLAINEMTSADEEPPTVVGIVVPDNKTIRLCMSETVVVSGDGIRDDFNIKSENDAKAAEVTAEGNIVTLEIAGGRSIIDGEILSLSYSASEGRGINDASGNAMADFNFPSIVTATEVTLRKETSLSVSNFDSEDLAFSSDGRTVFVADGELKTIFQFSVEEPFLFGGFENTGAYNVSEQTSSPKDIAFSSDGLTMFATSTGAIYQYSLDEDAPFDLNAGVRHVTSYSLDCDLGIPSLCGSTGSLAFLPDGKTAFVSAGTTEFVEGSLVDINLIFRLDLKTAFDLQSPVTSTLFESPFLEVTENLEDIAFSNDGKTVFVLSSSTDQDVGGVHQYSLETAFDLQSGLTHIAHFDTTDLQDIQGQDVSEEYPTGLAFSDDGLIMFVIGENVHRHHLPAPFMLDDQEQPTVLVASATDVASATSTTTIDLIMSELIEDNSVTASDFTISGAAGNPTVSGIAVSESTVTLTLSSAVGADEAITVSYTQTSGSIDDSSGNSLGDFQSFTVTGADRAPTVTRFVVTTPHPGQNFTTIDLIVSETVVVSGDNIEDDFRLRNQEGDVLNIFSVAASGNTVTLKVATGSDGSNLFSAEPFSLKYTASEGRGINDLDENPNAMANFDFPVVTTVTEATFYWTPVSAEISNFDSENLTFSSNGRTMFVADSGVGSISQFSLEKPFAFVGRKNTGIYNISEQTSSPKDIAFSSDGHTMFVSSTDGIHQYSLDDEAPFDLNAGVRHVTSYSLDCDLGIPSLCGSTGSLAFLPDGKTAFVSAGTTEFVEGSLVDINLIFRLDLKTAFDLQSPVTSTLFESPFLEVARRFQKIAFSSDGKTVFILDGTGGDSDVYQYSLETAFDLQSTVTLIETFELPADTGGLTFSDDGLNMLVLESDKAFRHTLPAPFTLTPNFDITPPEITAFGNVYHLSEFDEILIGGSSADRPEDHTGTSNTSNAFVTGFSEPDGVDCSGLVTYLEALALAEAVGARLPTLQ